MNWPVAAGSNIPTSPVLKQVSEPPYSGFFSDVAAAVASVVIGGIVVKGRVVVFNDGEQDIRTAETDRIDANTIYMYLSFITVPPNDCPAS